MKNVTRLLAFFLAALSVCMVLTTAAAARENETPVSVYIDGALFLGGKTVIIDGATYVPLRAFCAAACGCTASWDPGTQTATVATPTVTVTAGIGDIYIEVNGRALPGGVNYIEDGVTYVPVRSIAKALSMSVAWDNDTRAVIVANGGETLLSGDQFYNSDDLYWLSRIITCESLGEPMKGLVAVGDVILNRVSSDDFPDTVREVIFDRRVCIQFSPTASDAIYKDPDPECVVAAKLCLEGYSVTKSAIYFVDESISKSTWFRNYCTYVDKIGCHTFFS